MCLNTLRRIVNKEVGRTTREDVIHLVTTNTKLECKIRKISSSIPHQMLGLFQICSKLIVIWCRSSSSFKNGERFNISQLISSFSRFNKTGELICESHMQLNALRVKPFYEHECMRCSYQNVILRSGVVELFHLNAMQWSYAVFALLLSHKKRACSCKL